MPAPARESQRAQSVCYERLGVSAKDQAAPRA